MSTVITKQAFGTAVTILSGATELNSVASGATGGVSGAGTGAASDNSTTGYPLFVAELVITFGASPAAGGFVALYCVTAPDGTNYATASKVTALARGVFPVDATTAAQRIPLLGDPQDYPNAKCKFFVVNNTSQAFPASGAAVKLFPFAYLST